MEAVSATFRAGYVAIVGEPNVGKSTLLNALLGQKISIVTSKPQTTRQRVLGILSREDAQIIFLDTPGLLQPKYLLHETMVRSAQSALADADVILLLTEAGRGTVLPDVVGQTLEQGAVGKTLFLVINKVDTVPRDQVLPVIAHFAGEGKFKEIIPISALKGENLEDLLKTVIREMPLHPPLYPPDIVSESPERFFVAELIREAIFEQFHEEIPYSTAVAITEFKEREAGKTFINADIVVERSSQKGILIGAKGAALKKVGQSSRRSIEQFLERPVFLELHVKVRERWRESEGWLRKLGYSAGP
ncbi:MAG: GTPase Era [Ignavibacteriales bacterium]|nr:GTPase Era [Ignavibacteriales bacterium]